MATQVNHGLSKRAIDIIVQILTPYAKKIDRVALFGSRAQGTYRPNSDIDMVIYGQLNEREEETLFTDFKESDLSVQVDLIVYERINHLPLKQHIDQVAQTLRTPRQMAR